MKKMNLITKYRTTLVLTLVLTILLTNFVFAFGVASSYWKGNPLTISPGETTTITVRLQNMAGTEDEIVRVEITNGTEIASTPLKDYIVKVGTKDTEVPIEIKIPSDMQVDTTYQVTITSMTVSKQQGGNVALGIGVGTTFDVLVVAKAIPPPELKEEKPFGIFNTIIIVLIIIAIILIIIVLRRKSKKFIKR